MGAQTYAESFVDVGAVRTFCVKCGCGAPPCAYLITDTSTKAAHVVDPATPCSCGVCGGVWAPSVTTPAAGDAAEMAYAATLPRLVEKVGAVQLAAAVAVLQAVPVTDVVAP